MAKGVTMEVWGDYALFSRPELKTERYSYDVITPSAARGILDSIYFHPGMKWMVDKIHVLNSIVFTNLRRNEVKQKTSANSVLSAINGHDTPLYISSTENIVQRASTLLKDVRYVIEAHFELTDKMSPTDSEEKFYAMSMERIKKGKHYSQPYFGCREFTAYYSLCKRSQIQTAHSGTKDLGLMLYDMDYSDPENIMPIFFRAVMQDGVIDIKNCEVYK